MVADELMKAFLQETEITLLGSTKTTHTWKYQVKLSRESNFAAFAGSLLKTLDWGMRISFRESLSPSDQFGRLKRWKVYLPKLNQRKPMQADVVFCRILRKIRFFQHHAIPGPSWIDPMTMIFYYPVEKSYISLLSKKNDETIPLSLKKKSMHQTIRLIQHAGQTSGVFFKFQKIPFLRAKNSIGSRISLSSNVCLWEIGHERFKLDVSCPK